MKKKKNKYLEIIILLIIIASVTAIYFFSRTYLKKEANISYASDFDTYSMSKINKYQVVLNDISVYNIPLKRYIDTRNSSYYIFIKSTDNVITGISEVININYFDINNFTIEEIDNINMIETGYIVLEDDEENNEVNVPEEIIDKINDNIEIVESELTHPYNWIDRSTFTEQEFSNDTIINYCNAYNEIESNYSMLCSIKGLNIRIKNDYNLNSINGYIVKTKKYDVTLPVKRKTKLSDFIKEMKNKGIVLELVDEIK